MTGTFIDTIVICTPDRSFHRTDRCMAGRRSGRCCRDDLCIPTGAFPGRGIFPLSFMLCLVFFAFTTILAGTITVSVVWNIDKQGNQKAIKIFRWLYIFAVFIGPYMTVSAVWTIADIFNGLMALPNMIALFLP